MPAYLYPDSTSDQFLTKTGIQTITGAKTFAVNETLFRTETGDTILRLEADPGNLNTVESEAWHPRIIFHQDGRIVTTRIGYAENTNDFEIFSEYANSINFGTGNAVRMTLNDIGQLSFPAGGAPQTNSLLRIRRGGNSIEFGHGNQAGYASVIGAENGSGAPTIVFAGEHGATSNTYTSRGFRSIVMRYAPSTSPYLAFGSVADANLADQTLSEFFRMDTRGYLDIGARGHIARVSLYSGHPAEKGLVVRAEASQTANLFEMQNSAGTPLAWFNNGANLKIGTGTHPNVGTWLSIANGGASDVGLLVKGFAGQTADLIQGRDSADGVRFNIDSLGGIRNNVGPVGTAAGDIVKYMELYGTTANAAYLTFQMRRRIAGGGWENVDYDIYRKTDVTQQQRITFRGGSNSIELVAGSNDNNGSIYFGGVLRPGSTPVAANGTGSGGDWGMQGPKASPAAGIIGFGDGTGWRLEYWRGGGAGPLAYLTDAGAWWAASYNAISARETKDEITYLSESRGMESTMRLSDKFKKLRPVSYKSRSVPKESETNPTLYSFIAEEAAEVMPEIVSMGTRENKDNIEGINLTALVTLQTKVIQELMERIEALESR